MQSNNFLDEHGFQFDGKQTTWIVGGQQKVKSIWKMETHAMEMSLQLLCDTGGLSTKKVKSIVVILSQSVWQTVDILAGLHLKNKPCIDKNKQCPWLKIQKSVFNTK